MITKSKTIAGFQCPVCASVEMQELSAFEVGRDKLRISCSRCRQPFGDLIFDTKDKYRLSVVCIDCFVPHTFEVKRSQFWQSPFYTFDCPATEELIFVVGEQEIVQEALQENFYLEEE